jgi:hypothetical protein
MIMNDETIQKLLRKAPAISAPAELRNRLQTQIRLPRPDPRRADAFEPRSWLRRFMPALSFAAFFIACVLALGVQTSMMSELKHENAKLLAATKNLDQLRAGNAEFKRLEAQAQDLERLRKDAIESQQLQAEVAQLRAQLADAQQVTALNQRLQAGKATASTRPGANESGDFFAQNQARADRIICVNHLKQIGLAARIWANDNGDVLPRDFLSMSNEMVTPTLMQCPGDKTRSVTNWAQVAAGNVSYQMDAPGIDDKQPNAIFAECPIHHNILLVDGSVHQMSGEETQAWLVGTNAVQRTVVKIIDGKKYFVP